MKRTFNRLMGAALILAVVWFAMGAVLGLMPIIWSSITGETTHLYKYATWIDLSIWILWGLIVFGAIYAIRILLRRTRTTVERN